MRYENINGKNHIYLEDGEKLVISRLGLDEEKTIEVERKENTFNVVAPRLLINEIKSVDAKTSKFTIGRLCGEWIINFKEVFDAFKERAEKGQGTMILTVDSFCDSDDHYGKTISLDFSIYDWRAGLTNGAYLKLDDANDSIFKYLFAWVVDIYIHYCYNKAKVDGKKFDNKYTLTNLETDIDDNDFSTCIAHLEGIKKFPDEYKKIVDDIINIHNDDINSSLWHSRDIVFPLRDAVESQVIVDDLLKYSHDVTEERHNKVFEENKKEVK